MALMVQTKGRNKMAKYRGIDLDKKVTVRFNLGDEFGFANGCEGEIDDLEDMCPTYISGSLEWVSYIMVDLGSVIVPCVRHKKEAERLNRSGTIPGYFGETPTLTGMKVGWVEAQPK
jgi:hypothetical protein